MPEPNEDLIAAWRENAILRNPGSEKLADMITGATRDEIEQSARAAAERVLDIGGGEPDSFSQARQAYGPGPTAGGSSTSVPIAYVSPETRESRWQVEFADRFNNCERDPYGQRYGISQRDVERYTTGRFVEAVVGKLNQWAAITRSDAGYRRPESR